LQNRDWFSAKAIRNKPSSPSVAVGEESLRTAIHNFVIHYRSERNHQGLANRPISPEPDHLGSASVVQRRQRLGGVLNYNYRAS